MLILGSRRRPVRRSPVWYGGLSPDPARATTTALTFSNAMRTFYSFVYRPTTVTERDADAGGYFVKKLIFTHDVAPIFGPSIVSTLCSGGPRRRRQTALVAIGSAQFLSQPDRSSARAGARTDIGII